MKTLKNNKSHVLATTVFFLLAGIENCKNRSWNENSDTEAARDIQGIADELDPGKHKLVILCKGKATHETVTVEDIRQDKVCGGPDNKENPNLALHERFTPWFHVNFYNPAETDKNNTNARVASQLAMAYCIVSRWNGCYQLISNRTADNDLQRIDPLGSSNLGMKARAFGRPFHTPNLSKSFLPYPDTHSHFLLPQSNATPTPHNDDIEVALLSEIKDQTLFEIACHRKQDNSVFTQSVTAEQLKNRDFCRGAQAPAPDAVTLYAEEFYSDQKSTEQENRVFAEQKAIESCKNLRLTACRLIFSITTAYEAQGAVSSLFVKVTRLKGWIARAAGESTDANQIRRYMEKYFLASKPSYGFPVDGQNTEKLLKNIKVGNEETKPIRK